MGLTKEFRWTAAKLLNVSKLAVDSAVNDSLKGGMEVYEIVKGRLKGESASALFNGDKKRNSVMVEEMQVKLEKMEEDMNDIHHQCGNSNLGTEEQEHLKLFFDEPIKSSTPEVNGRKKIFIRSRL